MISHQIFIKYDKIFKWNPYPLLKEIKLKTQLKVIINEFTTICSDGIRRCSFCVAKDPSIPALKFIHKYEKLEAAPENPPEKCSRDRTGMKYYHVRAYMQHIERHVQGQDIFYRKLFFQI